MIRSGGNNLSELLSSSGIVQLSIVAQSLDSLASPKKTEDIEPIVYHAHMTGKLKYKEKKLKQKADEHSAR